MSAGVKVDLAQLCRAVEHSDAVGALKRAPSREALHFVIAIAMKSVAMAALGARAIELDLGNGHSLRCTVVDNATGAVK